MSPGDQFVEVLFGALGAFLTSLFEAVVGLLFSSVFEPLVQAILQALTGGTGG